MSAVAIFEERRRENADTIAMIRVLILLRVSSILEYRPFALSETIQSSSANVLLPTGIVCRNQMQRLLWRSYQNRNRYRLELRPFPSQNECKQEQDLPGFFPPWNMVAGLGRRQNLHWEWRIEGIVKRFICGRGWRDCKAAEDTSGGSDRCGYFIRFHVSLFRLVVGWNTFDHSFGNVLIQGVHKIYIWFYCMFEILRIAFMCS